MSTTPAKVPVIDGQLNNSKEMKDGVKPSAKSAPTTPNKKIKFTRIHVAPEAPKLEEVVKKILNANVYDAAIQTPLTKASILSRRLNNTVLIKREDLQEVFSFKVRGAYNMIMSLSQQELQRGVITASAGNHAQGVALAAAKVGIVPTIVMPVVTPSIKVNAVRARGANVLLHGDCFDDALEHCLKLVREGGLTYIPPYDHLDVIAGQGTVGMEILRQQAGAIDAIFVPVGGGGLIAGVAAYFKYLRPEIKVIGVESEDSACLKAALELGRPTRLTEVGVFADGVSVACVGEAPWSLINAYNLVDDVITVTVDEMCAAVKDVFEDTRAVAEPAGALSLAGLKKYIQATGAEHETLICINSGANTNFDRLQYIAERTELGEQREAIVAVSFEEGLGRFLKIVETLGKRKVTECVYRYADESMGQLFLGIQVEPGGDDRRAVTAQLASAGYDVIDLTDNELAKLHIRHLAGGRGVIGTTEVVFRFEFPERPSALRSFLSKLPAKWNITMFHYRNHGTAYASVLIGMVVPAEDQSNVAEVFDKIGYRCWDETLNPAYTLFAHANDEKIDMKALLTKSKSGRHATPIVRPNSQHQQI